jgi:hypothetical protein
MPAKFSTTSQLAKVAGSSFPLMRSNGPLSVFRAFRQIPETKKSSAFPVRDQLGHETKMTSTRIKYAT